MSIERINDVAAVVGTAMAAAFLIFLIALLIRARRRHPSDMALGAVLTSWLLLVLYSLEYRIHGSGSPWIAPAIWGVVTVVEIVACFYLIMEIVDVERTRAAADRAERAAAIGNRAADRLNAAVDRTEDAADHIERIAEEHLS